jgi:hypothetical protein
MLLKMMLLTNLSPIVVFTMAFFSVLVSLKESYEEALQRKDVKAIVVTGTCQCIL